MCVYLASRAKFFAADSVRQLKSPTIILNVTELNSSDQIFIEWGAAVD